MTTKPSGVHCSVLVGLAALAYLASVVEGSVRAEAQRWRSDRAYYSISYRTSVPSIPLNRIHAWVIHVETGSGDVVENAEITIEGGMPLHNHGLPTRPRVTGYLGAGDYQVEGVRFHMSGAWEIRITVSANGRIDVVTIPLQL